MPISLSDNIFKRGKNSYMIKSPLGRPVNGEALVEWSKKNKRGTMVSKETSWGLKLTFLANGEEPRTLIELNQDKLSKFIENLGCVTTIALESYGIGVYGPTNNITEDKESTSEAIDSEQMQLEIALCTQNPLRKLHTFTPEAKGTVTLGKIDITQSGFVFFSEAEMLTERTSHIEPKSIEKEVNTKYAVAE